MKDDNGNLHRLELTIIPPTVGYAGSPFRVDSKDDYLGEPLEISSIECYDKNGRIVDWGGLFSLNDIEKKLMEVLYAY